MLEDLKIEEIILQEEAELRAKLLREVDPNHDIFMLVLLNVDAWEPEAYKTGRVEYLKMN